VSVTATSLEAPLRRRFFQAMTGALLILVLVAFTPTFYFAERFGAERYPAYLVLHGGLLTLWFIALFVQSTLVAERRIVLHRRLGILAAVVGIAVVPAGLAAALGFPARLVAAEGELPAVVERLGTVVWGNVGMLAAFSLLLGSALVVRRNRGWHRRLMLIAGISLTGPAFARIARFDSFAGVTEAPLIAVGTGILLGALALFDLGVRGRLHAATFLGGATAIGLTGLGAAFGVSDTGRQLVLVLAAGGGF
jgi:hypothetical protein